MSETPQETGLSAPNISLDEAAIKSIAAALSDTVQQRVDESIQGTVSTIVAGVLEGLQHQIDSLKQENQSLRQQNVELQEQITALQDTADTQEQYSRRNSLRISGVKESAGESTDDAVLAIASAVGSSIHLADIDRTHRVGRPNTGGKPRDIIVKMATYRARQNLYTKRSGLKGSTYQRVFINEDLTRRRSHLMYRARQLVKVNKLLGAWSSDGVILVKSSTNGRTSIHRVTRESDLDRFLGIPATSSME